MSAVIRLLPVLARGQRGKGATPTVLAIVAFGFTSAFAISVLGGLHAFTSRAANPPAGLLAIDAQFYVQLAWVAVALLVVPIGALGGAAARLGVARRDARLATLRLLGATTAQVSGLTVIETLAQAAIGAIGGLGLYGLLVPIWTSLSFQGHRLTSAEMWPGADQAALAILGVVLLAGVSAVAGLRRVAITPLGVAARQRPKSLSVLRFGVLVVALIAWAIVSRGSSSSAIALVLACLVGVLAAFNLVGALVLSLFGRVLASCARKPGTLLAARRLVDDPKGAWRIAGGPSLACFVATTVGVGIALISADEGQMTTGAVRDILTGAWLTVAISFVLAAAQAGITQLASIFDRRRELALAHLAGVSTQVLEQGRRRQLAGSLAFTCGGASLTALLVLAPVMGLASLANPTALLATLGCVIGGVVLVLAAGESARPALRAVLAHPEPRPD